MTPASTSTAAAVLHAGAIVIDGTCPGWFLMRNFDDWRRGGATCCVLSVTAWEDAREAVGNIGEVLRFVREHADEVVLVTSAHEIRAAKADGRLGIMLQLQGTHPIEYDLDLIEVYHRIGVRVIQLAYNMASPFGDGCEEPRDAGLSTLGRQAIAELNRLGIVVDVSHTGLAASRDAVDVSTAPVIASHANAAAVHPSARNIPDDLIAALAGTGGLVGINGFSAFVGPDREPTLDQYVDHAVHVASVAGSARHVAIGLDYTIKDPPLELYEQYVRDGIWAAATYPPPPWTPPAGIEDASGLPRLTERLLARGFADDDVVAILGGNWLRVLDDVQRDASAA